MNLKEGMVTSLVDNSLDNAGASKKMSMKGRKNQENKEKLKMCRYPSDP